MLHTSHVHFSLPVHFVDVSVLSTTWNDMFRSFVDDASIWWQMFNLVFLSLKRWFKFNPRIVRTHFASVMTWKNWEMIAKTRSYKFRVRSRCRRRRVCLSFLVSSMRTSCEDNYSNLDPFRLLETHESTRVNSYFVQSFTMVKRARHPPGFCASLIVIPDRALGLKYWFMAKPAVIWR